MKKSCFIKLIFLLTIFTAAMLYIVNHKFNEVIFNPSKRLIINQVNRDLNYVKDSPEKDSLQILIKNYITGVKKIDNLSDSSLGEFIASLKSALKDSTIDSHEYKILYNVLNPKAVK